MTEKTKINNGVITIGGSPKASEPIAEVIVGMTDHSSSPKRQESPPSFERKKPMMMAYREAALSHRHMQKQLSLGDLMPKIGLEDKGKIARSRSLAMLGKSTSKTKNGIIKTKDLF